MGYNPEHPTTNIHKEAIIDTDERLARAEEEAARKTKYRDRLRLISVAESEIPGLWDTGHVSAVQLAEQYGISLPTVKRIIRDSGREFRRHRKLNPEEREQVNALIKSGMGHEVIAERFQVGRTTVRRIGVELGGIVPGYRRARRSDEEYALIESFDEECRQRFNGAGLYNLGLGLREWKRRQAKLKEANSWDPETETTPAPVVFPELPVVEEIPEDPEPSEALANGQPPEEDIEVIEGWLQGEPEVILEPAAEADENEESERTDWSF